MLNINSCWISLLTNSFESHIGDKGKKTPKNISDGGIEVFVGEMQGSEVILLSGHRSGVDSKRKSSEWRHFAAVKSVRTAERTISEINKSGPIWRKRSQKGFHQPGSGACLPLVATWAAELKLLETEIAEILSEAGVFSVLSVLLMEKWKKKTTTKDEDHSKTEVCRLARCTDREIAKELL